MRALALKELTDNGLDHAANVTLEQIDKDTWSVADDGPGMDAERIATLFAVDRPLTSTKLLRRPTRGAVGNGLRVVTGAAIASGGALWVESRGRRFEIKVHLGTGRTQLVEVPCNAPADSAPRSRSGSGPPLPVRRTTPVSPRTHCASPVQPANRCGRTLAGMMPGPGWSWPRPPPRVRRSPSCSPTWGSTSNDQRAAVDVASPSWRSSSGRRRPSCSPVVLAGS